jgi:cytidine deaminase
VAAALRGQDGRIWTGVHLGATVGRLSICAEAIALGRAVMEGDGTIATAVALRHPKPDEEDRSIAVVSPCGACREMITDYAPDALVIVPGPAGIVRLPIRDLLPLPYRR